MPISISFSETVFAVSTVFSWYGLAYFGIPVLVLLTTTICLSTRTCRLFGLLVSGSGMAIIALLGLAFLPESLTRRLSDDQLALVANITVCAGIVAGTISYRLGHELNQRFGKRPSKPEA